MSEQTEHTVNSPTESSQRPAPQEILGQAGRRGPFRYGERIQVTDTKGRKNTFLLDPHGYFQSVRGSFHHRDVVGMDEGSVIETDTGHELLLLRPLLADYVLSMPRGAQIMYPNDIAQVLQLGDIRGGMRVLESGGGSGAMSISLLEAVGSGGEVATIEIREEVARICKANATVFYGYEPSWWKVAVGSFDICCAGLPENYYDRIVLDMLDPWNRLEQAYRVISPGGVLACYVTTVTQVSRLAERLRSSGTWTEPEITETIERTWKADGLAVRPNHQMIGHTGFIVVSRAMACGHAALRKKGRAFKDTHTDIDSAASADGLDSLELRDMSDRKVRKVLRDLDGQVSQLHNPRLHAA